jgi:biopolymer transport protein ExbB
MQRRRLAVLSLTLAACALAIAQQPGLPPAEAAPAAAETEPTDAPPAERLTIRDLLRRGGPLMYPLYLASFIMVAFAIERGISLRRKRVLPRDVVDRLREVTADGELDVRKLLDDIHADTSPVGRIVKAGLRRSARPPAEIEKAVEDAGSKEAAQMRRNCRALSVIASVSPLLGLLGTVLGMIKAFMTVAAREEALGRTELLAAGIYQALVTTAVGLAIAIPALVLYYIFVDKVERLVMEMDDISIEVVERLGALERRTPAGV